jgi:DNA-binding response OmpR family regulator
VSKILIIEDDPAIQLGVEEYLSSQGYTVIKSSDGKQGYEIALKEKPDLILLDVNLPSLDGLQVCRMLREGSFRNPIVMLTSMADQVDKIVGLEVGADDYVTKPFDFRELLARIRAHLKYKDNKLTDDKNNLNVISDNKTVIDKTVLQADNGETLQRHLLAVMFSDMVEYSKKMNEDEKLTLVHLKAHDQIIDNAVIKFKGKVIEITGDGFLASFESATNALKCCKNIQEQFKAYNISKSEQEKVKIRIGLHIGDVVEFEGKIKGDTINIAKRIQENAEPESIYLSETFYLTVKGKTETEFNNLGTFDLKNIKEQMNIYKVVS